MTLTPDSSQVVIMDTGNMTLKYFYLNDNGGQLTGSSLAKTEHRPYTFSNMEFITDQLVIGYYDAGNEIPGTPDKPTFIITDLNGKVYYSQYKSYYSNKFHYSTGYPFIDLAQIFILILLSMILYLKLTKIVLKQNMPLI